MAMSKRKNEIATFLVLLIALPTAYGQRKDKAGSQDHPVISRYPGSSIANYEQTEFDQYNLVLGVDKTGAPDDVKALEGKVTRIHYRNPKGRSTLEIFRNFEQAVQKSGAEILFSCARDECGYPIRWTPVNGVRSSGALKEQRYLASHGKTNDTEIYISIYVGSQSTRLDVVEIEAMEEGLITVNAEMLATGIDRDGHIAVYAIYFDTGKANLKAESDPALLEIATLLKQRANLNLHVVGHTDSTGGFDFNMNLSLERAKAVADALVSQHGIAGERLRAHGVGPLSPVATNGTDDGRAENRRVDLVAQ